MKKEITVDEAISTGKRWVVNPSYIIFSFVLVVGFYFSFIMNDFPNFSIIIFTLIAILFLFIYRQAAIPKWKIWAFGNVRNVHELERKAKYYGILNKSNSFLGKNEFFSKEDELKWKEIQKNFSEIDVFIDNKTIPNEVRFFKSKIKIILRIFLYLFGLVSSIILVYFYSKDWYFLFGSLLFIWFLHGEIQTFLKSNSPFLILNDKGITIQDEKFYSWAEIKNDRMYVTPGNRSTTYWLSFDTNSGNEKLIISDIKNRDNLFDDLILFRSRYNQKNQ